MKGQKVLASIILGAMFLNQGVLIASASTVNPPATPKNANSEVTSDGLEGSTEVVAKDGKVFETKTPESVGKVEKEEVKEALTAIDGLLEESERVVSREDHDSASETEQNGTKVDIPKRPDAPVKMETAGVEMEIKLPKVENAKEGEKVANGVVAYASESNFSNAVQANEDGSVRMTTIIDDPTAPTEYEYEIGVEGEFHLQKAINDEGKEGVLVMNAEQTEVLKLVSPAWALDADGNEVETYFEIRGNKLVQVVNHNVEGVVYPVTADPRIEYHWWGRIVRYNRHETLQIAHGHNLWGLAAPLVPWGGYPLGVVVGMLSFRGWAIQRMHNRGNCLAVARSGYVNVWTWEYAGSGCWW